MIPGPKSIYECPECKNLISKGSILSGNTFGAVLFSDAKNVAPMLPEFPFFVRCNKCGNFLWLNELKSIGTCGRNDDCNSKWENAQNAEFPKIEDYFDALNSDVAETKGKELHIRQKIWWAYNDRVRNKQEIFNSKEDELRWKENCIQLIKIFDYSNVNQRIMIAELNRNLGNFEKCLTIMDDVDGLDWVKEKLKTECERKNRLVVKLSDK